MAGRPKRANDGYFHEYIELGWRGGKRRRHHIKAKRRADLDEKVKEARRQLILTGNITTRSMTVEQFAAKWMRKTEDKVAPRTYGNRESNLRLHIVPFLGKIPLVDLTTDDVHALGEHIAVGRHKRDDPPTWTAARKAHSVLQTMLTAAEREGILTRNVATIAETPTEPLSDREGLSVEEAKKLLAATKGTLVGRFATVVLYTLARRGEVLGLEPDRVTEEIVVIDGEEVHLWEADLSWQLGRVDWYHDCPTPCGTSPARCPQRKLKLPRNREYRVIDGTLILSRPKTKRSRRRVPLAGPAERAIRDQRKANLSKPNPHGLLWINDDGSPIDPSTMSKMYLAARTAAGIERNAPLHATRNTGITLLIQAGVPLKVVQELAGHTRETMTLAYQGTDITDLRRAVGELEERLA